MASFKEKPAVERADAITLESLGKLHEQLLDTLEGYGVLTLMDLANWLYTHSRGDVLRLKNHVGIYVFNDATWDLLMRVALYHPSLKDHDLVKRWETDGTDNPYTTKVEGAGTVTQKEEVVKKNLFYTDVRVFKA